MFVSQSLVYSTVPLDEIVVAQNSASMAYAAPRLRGKLQSAQLLLFFCFNVS